MKKSFKALTVCCALVLGSVAISGQMLAQAAPTKKQHSVVGVFSGEGANPNAFDAYLANNGDAEGTVYGQLPGEDGTVFGPGGVFTLERVVCLAVDGNRATVVTQILQTNHPGHAGGYQVYSVIDNGATGDLIGGGFLGEEYDELACGIDHSDPPAGYGPVTGGDLTVD